MIIETHSNGQGHSESGNDRTDSGFTGLYHWADATILAMRRSYPSKKLDTSQFQRIVIVMIMRQSVDPADKGKGANGLR